MVAPVAVWEVGIEVEFVEAAQTECMEDMASLSSGSSAET